MAGQMVHAAMGRVSAIAVVLVLALSTSGCWLQLGAGPGHTRFNLVENGLTAANVDTLHEVWSIETPGLLSEPMVSEGRLFVTQTSTSAATWSASVLAVDTATGRTLWDHGLTSVAGRGAYAFGTPVTFVGGRLWTGSLSHDPDFPGGAACVAERRVLDPVTGGQFGIGGFGYPSGAASSGDVVARAVFYPADGACVVPPVVKLEVDGPGIDWDATIPGMPQGGAPTLAGDHVFLVYGATLYAYAVGGCGAPTCEPVWTKTAVPGLAVSAPPVSDGAGPLFVRFGPDLVALDRASGAERWRAPHVDSGVAVAEGVLYVTGPGDAEDEVELHAYPVDGCGAATCEPLWTAPLGGYGGSVPVVGGGVVYVSTVTQGVLAFDADGCDAATCEPLAAVAAPHGTPVLAEGKLFVATDSGLTALAPDGG